MPLLSHHRLVFLVMAGHFLSAFTVLGAPLFLPRFLPMLHPALPHWAIGMLFCLPTIMTALAAPFWGWVSDHYGRKRSLQRAHLGLALGFALAGSTSYLGVFILGLAVQGFFGGAMAASNAYLTTHINRSYIQAILAGTQLSARLAMVMAPASIGCLLDLGLGTRLYLWLGLLPLIAFLSTFFLPADPIIGDHHASLSSTTQPPTTVKHWAALLMLQAVVSAAPVLTFPYFMPYCATLGIGSGTETGLLYALPHIVCLIGLPWLRHSTYRFLLPLGLLTLGGACLGHVILALYPLYPPWQLIILLSVFRLIMGLGLVMALTGLNVCLSRMIIPSRAGRAFSRFDAAGKWAGATAGISSGIFVQSQGILSPFSAATILSLMAIPLTMSLKNLGKTPS
ncbi:MFS transporter [Saccharibacter sp. 17.LH.SD]|uniref:MFS transporter n=1 Tax=Saccharibacter sp. 17.LH.SD TaxID=2689393 RepID=UPI0013694140|nr:MFS transporter [Saccharibacter sp. 17.LH.SD]MXV44410.1 MFS transporter [Saccharibacter sp. 17.LH.SD]